MRLNNVFVQIIRIQFQFDNWRNYIQGIIHNLFAIETLPNIKILIQKEKCHIRTWGIKISSKRIQWYLLYYKSRCRSWNNLGPEAIGYFNNLSWRLLEPSPTNYEHKCTQASLFMFFADLLYSKCNQNVVPLT